MAGRFSRSWSLIKYSAAVLNQDRELLVFPLLASVAAILVIASFFPALAVLPEVQNDSYRAAVFGAIYLLEYFVIIFFNSALIGAAMIRMQGGNPTVMDGLQIAGSRVVKIFGYALIAATVGVILRAISERVAFIGQLVVGLIGMTWTAASFLTVPVLVSREIGPLAAVQESAALLKKTWGENLIATGGLGLVFNIVYIAVVFLAFYAAYRSFNTHDGTVSFGFISAGAIALMLIALVHAALQGIFAAALYNYAANGEHQYQKQLDHPTGRSELSGEDLFANAFRPK